MHNLPVHVASVVVVTCGVSGHLWDCLASLVKQTYGNLQIVVVDNSCGGDIPVRLSEYAPAISLIVNQRNEYYGASLNKGISLSSGEYILCLNDDVILERDFVAQAIQGFSADPRIGMVSGKVLRRDGKTLDSTGMSLSLWGTVSERGYGKLDKGQFDREGFVFGVTGAAAFYRKTMLRDIGKDDVFFDTRMRMFYEDLDLSWRASRRGWKGYYLPSAKAYHVRGGSVRCAGGEGKRFARRYLNDEFFCDLVRNRHLAVSKNISVAGLLLRFPFMVCYDIIEWIYILFFRPRLIRSLCRFGQHCGTKVCL